MAKRVDNTTYISERAVGFIYLVVLFCSILSVSAITDLGTNMSHSKTVLREGSFLVRPTVLFAGQLLTFRASSSETTSVVKYCE